MSRLNFTQSEGRTGIPPASADPGGFRVMRRWAKPTVGVILFALGLAVGQPSTLAAPAPTAHPTQEVPPTSHTTPVTTPDTTPVTTPDTTPPPPTEPPPPPPPTTTPSLEQRAARPPPPPARSPAPLPAPPPLLPMPTPPPPLEPRPTPPPVPLTTLASTTAQTRETSSASQTAAAPRVSADRSPEARSHSTGISALWTLVLTVLVGLLVVGLAYLAERGWDERADGGPPSGVT